MLIGPVTAIQAVVSLITCIAHIYEWYVLWGTVWSWEDERAYTLYEMGELMTRSESPTAKM
jgi:hypothetical protein